MELRCPTPALPLPLPLLLLLLLVAGLTPPHAAAAAAAAPSDQTRLQVDDSVDYRAEILVEVDRMNGLLTNMTIDLGNAKIPKLAHSPVEEGGDDTAPDPDTQLEQDPFALTLELLPHKRVLSKRSVQSPRPHRLALERQTLTDEPTLEPCKKDAVNKALDDSTVVLDKVTAGEFNPDVLSELEKQNDVLNGFFDDVCSLASMDPTEADDLIDKVMVVQTLAEEAKEAATPAETGLPISSAYMVVLITLCCLMALIALVGLAVLAFRYTSTSTSNTTTTSGGGGGGGGRGAQAGGPKRTAGQLNPAYQPTVPTGSLHQARNERWQRPGNHELQSSHRPPAPSNSTLGRMWGGVVRAYQRSRDSVAEPTNGGARGYPTDEPRREPRAATPPRRYSPRPTRRASPPPRRASPPPPRRASPPPPRHNSPPPLHRHNNSPPPRRNSPPPQAEGGDNWAYGPTGRSKSTDSPFASAW